MTAAYCSISEKWRVIQDSKVRAVSGSAEETRFILACEGYAIVATVEYPEYGGCTIMWTNDFSDSKLHVRYVDGKWIVAWSRHYRIASFPDRDSAFEWVRNSFDDEKTFRKTSDAEYVVRFGRKT